MSYCLNIFCTFLIFSLLFSSCDFNIPNSNSSKPASIGDMSRILVLSDSAVFASPAGRSLSDIFEKNYPALNQAEPYFSLMDIRYFSFNKLLKRSKIVLVLCDINRDSRLSNYMRNNLGKERLTLMKEKEGFYLNFIENEWAKPQLLILCAGLDESSLQNGIEKYKSLLFTKVSSFEEKEMEKKYAQIRGLNDHQKSIEQKFNLDLKIPSDYKKTLDGDSFLCFTKEIENGYMCISFYQSDYKDTLQFSTKELIKKRNVVLKNHLKGELENTYIKTEERFPTLTETMPVDSSYSKRLRGLWRMANDFMGGPFINQNIHLAQTHKIVHIDGLVYSPGKAKKKYIKEIECLFSGIKIKQNDL